jgi:hypothetical protein
MDIFLPAGFFKSENASYRLIPFQKNEGKAWTKHSQIGFCVHFSKQQHLLLLLVAYVILQVSH